MHENFVWSKMIYSPVKLCQTWWNHNGWYVARSPSPRLAQGDPWASQQARHTITSTTGHERTVDRLITRRNDTIA